MTKLLAQISVPLPDILKNNQVGLENEYQFVSIVVSRLLIFAISAAGIFFFVKLLSAGYAYLTSAGDSGKLQSASKDLINGTIGLVLVISSYFIAQLIEVVFGIKFI